MISRITISLRKNVRIGSGREDDWIMYERTENPEVTTFAFGMGGRREEWESDDDDSLSLESIEVPITRTSGDIPLRRLS